MNETFNNPTLIPTAEPFFYSGNEIGCLLVHGFTDSPKEMRPLGEYLNQQGYSVLGVRITGHATTIENLRRTRGQDFIASVEDGYHFLKSNSNIKKIFVIGHSMGAGLTLFVSSYLPVDGVVVLAPGYRLSKPGKINEYLEAIRLYRLSLKRKKMARKLKNNLPGWYWYKPELSKGYVKYNQKPIRCNLQLIKLGNQMPFIAPKVTSPILFMGSLKDSIVAPESLEKLFDSIGSKDKSLFWLENSSHMLPVDGEREIVFQQINQFIQKIVKELS